MTVWGGWDNFCKIISAKKDLKTQYPQQTEKSENRGIHVWKEEQNEYY